MPESLSKHMGSSFTSQSKVAACPLGPITPGPVHSKTGNEESSYESIAIVWMKTPDDFVLYRFAIVNLSYDYDFEAESPEFS